MKLIRMIRYAVVVLRCLEWRPPPGLEHTVTIDPDADKLVVNLITPGGIMVMITVDSDAPLRGLYDDLDGAAHHLYREMGWDETGIGRDEPALTWD